MKIGGINMALKFKTLKCNSDNYGAKRSLKDIKWI